jgi:hypothetical protein
MANLKSHVVYELVQCIGGLHTPKLGVVVKSSAASERVKEPCRSFALRSLLIHDETINRRMAV